jgi:hypothetical protein
VYILFIALLTVDIPPTVGDVLEGDNQTITCTVSGKAMKVKNNIKCFDINKQNTSILKFILCKNTN